ncbi:hypothetical protein K3495_g8571 [Podosphaera aphanis]|nr:hypothetical protein K3495_g8571 [Podosphaera aphanis]
MDGWGMEDGKCRENERMMDGSRFRRRTTMRDARAARPSQSTDLRPSQRMPKSRRLTPTYFFRDGMPPTLIQPPRWSHPPTAGSSANSAPPTTVIDPASAAGRDRPDVITFAWLSPVV